MGLALPVAPSGVRGPIVAAQQKGQKTTEITFFMEQQEKGRYQAWDVVHHRTIQET
ncbi:hypothetical protein [Variovorax sp. SRS16]|uniref:hypothetical protein n=1 Tax=Variovorax sp. SRS16 TaxID=282217 RepID=UPI0013A5545D|nr:hypothetical protein [Variovorax sp. SRS16]